MSEEVDLIVVKDHQRAERIVRALKHAGIHHVEFWPANAKERYYASFRCRLGAPHGALPCPP